MTFGLSLKCSETELTLTDDEKLLSVEAAVGLQ